MKAIYFECNMGAAGDMLLAALLELCDNRSEFLEKMNSAGIPGAALSVEPSIKCGIMGTSVKVTIDGREEICGHEHDDNRHEHEHHSHSAYHDIEHIISNLNISNTTKKNSLKIYNLIAEAESEAHGVPIRQIHFHEVGEMDAVVDIVGVCMLMEELAPDIIISSPINVGGGSVRCAHGVLPIPAPATASILRDIPIYGSEPYMGELCTPTGAALLKHFAKKFCAMPPMTVCNIGYGMGKKDLDRANCVRAFIGNVIEDDVSVSAVIELVCNIDDMTPESVSFAQELLMREGALDAIQSPIVMKKGRLGVKFSCMCNSDTKDKMLSLIFKHTTTLGVRENVCRRYALKRESAEIQTPYGQIKIKTASGYGVEKSKPEYDDVAKIAVEHEMSLSQIKNKIKR